MSILDKGVGLPFPPSVNHYHINRVIKTKSGKHIVTKFKGPKAKEFLKEAKRIYSFYEQETIDFPVKLSIELYPPDRRKRDLDNGIKIVQDSLELFGILENDCLIKHLEVKMKEVRSPGGFCYIRITRIDDDR